MIVEREIERQIIQAFREDGYGVYYSGAWTEPQAGEVKGDEDDDACVVAVTVAPRRMTDYSGGYELVEAEIPVSVSCSVSTDADPTGAQLMSLYERISKKIWSWVKGVHTGDHNELVVADGEGLAFEPGGVQQSEGVPPTYSAAAHIWSWRLGFNVKGIIK